MKLTTGKDINGNSTLILITDTNREFGVQTNNGSFPQTHRSGLGPYTLDELRQYIYHECGMPQVIDILTLAIAELEAEFAEWWDEMLINRKGLKNYHDLPYFKQLALISWTAGRISGMKAE